MKMDTQMELAKMLWLFAALIFVAGMVGAFWPWLKMIGHKPSPIISNGIAGIEYYPNRAKLGPLIQEFANVKKAWVFWYTGSTAIDQGHYLNGKVARMIFLHPKCNYRPEFKGYLQKQIRGGRSPKQEADKIEHFSAVVREKAKDIQIRWLNDVPDYFFVINNPNSDDAWVRIESFDLSKNADHWHSYRIHKKEHPYLFEVLKRKYEQLWERSEKYGEAKKETSTKKEGKKGGKA
jgi:hypothetical protein